MNTQAHEEQEYAKFMYKLAEKINDLMGDYRNLSPENQNRVSEQCKKIVLTQGFAGMMMTAQNPLNN